jgi:sulfur carrier protein
MTTTSPEPLAAAPIALSSPLSSPMSTPPSTPLSAPTPDPVTLNGTPVADLGGHGAVGLSLAELLARHPETAALAPEAIATAVNQAFVARAQRATRRLQPGDAVTVFQAIVGG